MAGVSDRKDLRESEIHVKHRGATVPVLSRFCYF